MARRPPVFQTQQVIPPEVYRWLDNLERGTFEDEGISMATAANQLPPGLESAPAQREYSFKEAGRFAPVSQRWEEAVAVETAKKMVAMYRAAADGADNDDKPVMVWANRSLREEIDWESASLDENAYQIRAEASSLEALSPSSRTQAAIELSQTGWITPQEGRSLLGHPDLQESDRIGSAPTRYAQGVLKQLLLGVPVAVNEYAHLPELHRVVQGGYLDACDRKAPRELLANCERFLEELDTIMNPPAPMGPGGMPSPDAAGVPAESPPMPALSDPAAMGAPLPFPGGQ